MGTEVMNRLDDFVNAVEAYDEAIYEIRETDEEMEDTSTFWDHFYYGSDVQNFDGSWDWENRDPITLPEFGPVEYVLHEEYLDAFGDKIIRVIVKVDGHNIACEGWYNSWDGDGAFEGPVYEVVPKQVTTTVWEKVS